MPYEIEKNIPLPDRPLKGRSATYPFAEMEVGDSFFVPAAMAKDKTKVRTKIRTASYMFRRNSGLRHEYMYESEDEGIRCWRSK